MFAPRRKSSFGQLQAGVGHALSVFALFGSFTGGCNRGQHREARDLSDLSSIQPRDLGSTSGDNLPQARGSDQDRRGGSVWNPEDLDSERSRSPRSTCRGSA
jgi:hypothetical protein